MNGIIRGLIIALATIANVQAIRSLRVGDTLNLFRKNDSNDVRVRDIFNGFNGTRFIEKKNDSYHNYEKFYESCMLFENLKGYFYPKVSINEIQTDDASSKLFHGMDLWRNEYLDVNRIYVDNQKFRYGIVKLCKVVEVQSLSIDLINSTHFPQFTVNGYNNILMNKTVAFRLKQDDETHYVSSVSTGTCLIQIFVNDAIECENNEKKSQDHIVDFFRTSMYRTSFTTVSNNSQLEKKINEYYYLNELDYSLLTFPYGSHIHRYIILSKFENKEIVSLKLHSLPELPVVSKPQGGHTPVRSRTLIKRDDITPGTAFNLKELLYSRSKLATVNLLKNNDKSVTPSSIAYGYSNCRRYVGNETPNLENGKLDVFEQILKRENYGIDLQYPVEGKTCLKFTVCSRSKKQELQLSSMMVIKLNEDSKNNDNYNIFEDKNIMLWYSEGDETHFVLSTEKGDCVSQTLIFPGEADNYDDKSIFARDPILNGRILSATGNHYLEQQVGMWTNNDLKYVFGNKNNVTAMLKVNEELEYSSRINNTLLQMYLHKLL